MSVEMETIYNEHIAEEKLKQGTKYEKLAAVVFKILNSNDTVIHDLTLRGDGKNAAHQIDVTIQNQGSKVAKRILIECKDYESTVGISIVRDFFGAISQIKPDEAFIVTTKGYTKGARSFAEDEGIKLALLRAFKEEDWEGRIKAVHISSTVTTMNPPKLSWIVANELEAEKFHANANPDEVNKIQGTSTSETFFYNEMGIPQENFQSVLEPIFSTIPLDSDNLNSGKYEFNTIKYVKLASVLVGVKGFHYEVTSSRSTFKTIANQGSRIALLVFKVLEGDLDKLIFDQDLDKWTFDDEGKVIGK